MKKTLLLLLCICLTWPVFGQYTISASRYDSLTRLLAEAGTDTLKRDVLMELGIANQYVNPSLAAQYLNESLRLSRKIKDKDRIMGALLTLGFLYSRIGEPAKSIEMHQEALRYFEETKNDISMPLAFIANNYEAQGDLKNAIDYARRSFQVYEKRIQDKIPTDERGYPAGPMRLGQIFEKMGQLDSAMYYAQISYQRVLEKPLAGEWAFFYCQICNLLGTLHSELNRPGEAIRFYRLALQEAILVDYENSIQESQSALAKFYYKTNHLDSTIYYATQAYEGAAKIKGFDVMKQSAGLLRTVYEQKGEFAKALYYNDLAIAARDSVTGAEKVREVQSLTYKEEQRQQKIQQEIETNQVAYQNRIKFYSLLAVLAGLLLLATILYRNNRQKQKANALLEAQKKEIEQQGTELQQSLQTLHATQSQLVAQKERAEASEAFKSRFLANMSHEIRTPLHGIAGSTDLLLDTSLSEKQRRWLSAIHHSTERLGEVVNNILDLSKLEAGQVNLRQVPFSPARVAADVQEALALRAENKGIALTLQVAAGVPAAVSGDATRLYQILMNLVGNAVKFTEKGAVRLAIEASASPLPGPIALTFTITDTGIGIPPEKRAAIFDSFQQADDDTTVRFGGTGLGLTIARELVQLHGSDIRVDSQVGQGSIFSFTLAWPLAQATELDLEGTRVGWLQFAQPIRILLADDNALNREIATEAIRRHFENADVQEAQTGKEAVELLERQDFDLVLMDMQMPEMTGTEATRYIRSQLPGKKRDTPILALTASATPEEIENALQSGMNRHLAKPFKPHELAKAIAEVLGLTVPARAAAEFVEKPTGSAEPAGTIDLTFLRDFTSGDAAQMQHFIRRFLEQYPLEIGQLEAALQAKDREAVFQAAHSFRPQLEFMGLKNAASLIRTLEQGAQQGRALEELSALLAQIKVILQELPDLIQTTA